MSRGHPTHPEKDSCTVNALKCRGLMNVYITYYLQNIFNCFYAIYLHNKSKYTPYTVGNRENVYINVCTGVGVCAHSYIHTQNTLFP